MLAVKAQTSLAFARSHATLTALRALEPAPARHSKSKLFLCSRLLAAFTLLLYKLHLIPTLDNKPAILACYALFNLVLGKAQCYHVVNAE